MIPGSHTCGRLNHAAAGGLQTGADIQRVQELLKILPETYVELEAGKSGFIQASLRVKFKDFSRLSYSFQGLRF